MQTDCSRLIITIQSLKSLDILKVISKTKYGADRKSMLLLYRSLTRSHLDYGVQVYGNATETTLKMLNSVHHSGIRLCTGAFRTSPVNSLLVEAGEPPLSVRRIVLCCNYTTFIGGKTHILKEIICPS